MLRRERKKSIKKSEIRKEGRRLFTNLQRITLITIVSTVGYLIFAPTLLFYLFDQVQVLLFPEIETNQDYYGLIAYLIFFTIHLAIIRIFVPTNEVFFLGLFLIQINLGLFVLVGQFIFPLIVFAIGENVQFNVQFLNLIGLILMYDVLYLIFSWILIEDK